MAFAGFLSELRYVLPAICVVVGGHGTFTGHDGDGGDVAYREASAGTWAARAAIETTHATARKRCKPVRARACGWAGNPQVAVVMVVVVVTMVVVMMELGTIMATTAMKVWSWMR